MSRPGGRQTAQRARRAFRLRRASGASNPKEVMIKRKEKVWNDLFAKEGVPWRAKVYCEQK